jgi:ketosteroid isomerase-like protein
MSAVATADAQTRGELLALEERRQNALIDGDLATLDEIFDDALVHIHAPGLVHTKALLMEHVGTRRAYLDIVRGELSIRVIGDVAIMVGSITNMLKNPDGSMREQRGQVTQVVRRGDDGVWRFVNFQLTPIGEEVWGKLPSERIDGAGSAEMTEGTEA